MLGGRAQRLALRLSQRGLVLVVFCLSALLFAVLFGALVLWPGGAWLGLTVYCAVEAFGAVSSSLIWSVVATSTERGLASLVYPVLLSAQQLGAMLGAGAAGLLASYGQAVVLAAFAVSLVGGAGAAVFALAIACERPAEVRGQLAPAGLAEEDEDEACARPAGSWTFGGLELFWQSAFVAGILAVTALDDIVSILLDFSMKLASQQRFATPAQMTAFMGYLGFAVNGIGLVFSFGGSAWLFGLAGLRACLVLLPAVSILIAATVWVRPSLWVYVGAIVLVRVIKHTVSKPASEMLYLATSRSVKVRAKAWADTIGSKGSKAAGSLLNHAMASSPNRLAISALASVALSALWLLAAMQLGRTYLALDARGRQAEKRAEVHAV